MKSTTIDSEIRSRIDAFIGELSTLVRLSALEAVHNALGSTLNAGAMAPKRGPGRPAKSGTPSPLVSAPKAAAKRKRGKRSQEDVLAVAGSVLGYIKAHQGERLEQIAKGMNVASKELKLPILKLFEQKAIKTTGEKRGTKYFVK